MAPHTHEFTSVAWVVRPLPPLVEASRLTKQAAACRQLAVLGAHTRLQDAIRSLGALPQLCVLATTATSQSAQAAAMSALINLSANSGNQAVMLAWRGGVLVATLSTMLRDAVSSAQAV